MRRRATRWLIVGAAAMTAFGLAACTNDGGTTPGQPVPNNQQPQSAPADAKVVSQPADGTKDIGPAGPFQVSVTDGTIDGGVADQPGRQAGQGRADRRQEGVGGHRAARLRQDLHLGGHRRRRQRQGVAHRGHLHHRQAQEGRARPAQHRRRADLRRRDARLDHLRRAGDRPDVRREGPQGRDLRTHRGRLGVAGRPHRALPAQGVLEAGHAGHRHRQALRRRLRQGLVRQGRRHLDLHHRPLADRQGEHPDPPAGRHEGRHADPRTSRRASGWTPTPAASPAAAPTW